MEHLLALLFTAAAGLGAEAAVLVHLRVAFALLCTDAARFRTGLKLLAGERHVGFRKPGEDVAGSHADLSAVKVQADAADQFLDRLLAEARVCTGGATLSTVIAGFDAFLETGKGGRGRAWVGAKHFRNVGHVELPRLVATWGSYDRSCYYRTA